MIVIGDWPFVLFLISDIGAIRGQKGSDRLFECRLTLCSKC